MPPPNLLSGTMMTHLHIHPRVVPGVGGEMESNLRQMEFQDPTPVQLTNSSNFPYSSCPCDNEKAPHASPHLLSGSMMTHLHLNKKHQEEKRMLQV